MAPGPEPGWDWFAISPDRGQASELTARLPRLRALGVRRFVLREKSCPPAARRAIAQQVVPACARLGIECWISEDAALAAEAGARGVHLSERSASPRRLAQEFPDLHFGVSLHDPLRRPLLDVARCDHAFLGPVFATPSKAGAAGLGIEGFLRIAERLPIPVYPLGGIGAAELDELARAGVHRAAGIRLFFASDDIEAVRRRAVGRASARTDE